MGAKNGDKPSKTPFDDEESTGTRKSAASSIKDQGFETQLMTAASLAPLTSRPSDHSVISRTSTHSVDKFATTLGSRLSSSSASTDQKSVISAALYGRPGGKSSGSSEVEVVASQSPTHQCNDIEQKYEQEEIQELDGIVFIHTGRGRGARNAGGSQCSKSGVIESNASAAVSVSDVSGDNHIILPVLTDDTLEDGDDGEDGGARQKYQRFYYLLRTYQKAFNKDRRPKRDGQMSEKGIGSREEKNQIHKGRQRSILSMGIETFKYIYSLALLLFSVIVVMDAIFTEQTVGTADKNFHPVIAFVLFWALLCWLAMVEGAQVCMVGLQPIDKHLYVDSHRKAFNSTSVLHRGDNMERFLVGRQFLFVVLIFMSNLVSTAIPDADILGFGDRVRDVFATSGFALMIITIILGQLVTQINASISMLDFINNYFTLYFITYVSLAIEFSGLLHSVYLIQIVFTRLTGKPNNVSNEPPRTAIQSVFFWTRVCLSVYVLSYALAVTFYAIFTKSTTMWDSTPSTISMLAFVSLMCIAGIMEGMLIALVAVVKTPQRDDLERKHPIAHRNCQLTFRGSNLQSFMIGRQICVTVCMFLIARITTLDIEIGVDDNIFHVNDSLQEFFNTGLLGAIVTTIFASLVWRVIASNFPITFLSNPFIFLIIKFCCFLEASGVCAAAWMFARWKKIFVGYQTDNVYLDGAEKEGRAPVTRRDKDIDTAVTLIKYLCSVALLCFSVAVVVDLIFSGQTKAAQDVHPLFAFFFLIFLFLWLGMLEGGQVCMDGLRGLERTCYEDTHKSTHMGTGLIHRGDNMERFIVGRQFLTVIVMIGINVCGAALTTDSKALSLPDWMMKLFVSSGMALMLVTGMVGQLAAQVNATACMLDFMNSKIIVLMTTYASLAVEYTGLLHSVYLIQFSLSKICGIRVKSQESPRSNDRKAFFWARIVLSMFVVLYAFAVTISAMIERKTTVWDGISPSASLVLLFGLLCFAGLTEGMKVALCAVKSLPAEEFQTCNIAKKTRQLVFAEANFQTVLIGRQICLTACIFLLARMATLNVDIGFDQNIYNVSNGTQEFFNTGILGSVIVTVFGLLVWRMLASAFPIAFLSNPLVYMIIRLCLALESSGICSASWILAYFYRKIGRLQMDETYIGTPNDANQHGLDIENNVIEVDVTYQPRNIQPNNSTLESVRSVTLQLRHEKHNNGKKENARPFQPPSLKVVM